MVLFFLTLLMHMAQGVWSSRFVFRQKTLSKNSWLIKYALSIQLVSRLFSQYDFHLGPVR